MFLIDCFIIIEILGQKKNDSNIFSFSSLQLSFTKNDIIILTQAPADGGWWEGTLNGKTGWFPSNYVEQIVQKSGKE